VLKAKYRYLHALVGLRKLQSQHVIYMQLGAGSRGADAKRAAGYVRAEVKQLEAARHGASDAAHARTLLLLQGQAHHQLYRQACKSSLFGEPPYQA
jgi:hypothetical protein